MPANPYPRAGRHSLWLRFGPMAGLLLAITAPSAAGAASMVEPPIAFCTATSTDNGGRGTCVCGLEDIETPLAPFEYLQVLTTWRRLGMLNASELAALEREQRAACDDGASKVPPAAIRVTAPWQVHGRDLSQGVPR